MTTIRDVAKRAGVAVSTVSKVINHYPNVSEQTIRRVNEAIEELQFVPNAIAASLSSKQSARICLLVNPSTQTQAIDEITMQYMIGAINQARGQKCDVVPMFFSMLEGKTIGEIENYLQAQNIGGVVIAGMSKDDEILQKLVERERFKFVLIDVPLVNASSSYVGIDHKAAQKDIARKTIVENEGESDKILYITGKKNGYVTDERLEAMEELAGELNLSLNVQCGDFSEKKAREITLTHGKDADIIVCASDLMAIGAMRALIDMDVFHPVCGYDGITLMGYAGKQMNTVKQDFRRIASEAVAECVRLMSGDKGRKVILPHELVRLEYEDIIV